MHEHAAKRGGMWRYNAATVQTDVTDYVLTHCGNYSTLLDVAVNHGYMINRLQHARPKAEHWGTDISRHMVGAAAVRCERCAGFGTMDLNKLELPNGFPKAFDVVVVSDVLFFMAWAGLPPAACRVLPSSVLRASQRRFFRSLTRLAIRQVVFSDHEDNPCVVDFLKGVGAVRKPTVATKHRRARSVWIAKGDADLNRYHIFR